ncbi:MAG: CARDB domain-containing protein [Saprospiraceae bacterium]
MAYVKVDQLGDASSNYAAAIYVDSASVSMQHSVISNTNTTYFKVTPRTPQLLSFTANEIPFVTVENSSQSTSIWEDAAWALPDVSYWLEDDLYVTPGATLSLAAGTKFWFPSRWNDLYVDGTLKAIGTVTDSIYFVGTSTNLNENGGNIIFSSKSKNNELAYVKVDQLGDISSSFDAAIYVDSASVSMQHSVISNTNTSYFRVTPRTPQLLSFENNDIPTVHIQTGLLLGSAVWALPDSSYSLEGNVSVSIGDTLTLQAGTEVHFPNYARSFLVYGTLLAEGTATNKIRLFGSGLDNANLTGYGGAIYFESTSVNNRLSYVQFEEMGIPALAGYPYGAIVARSPSLSIRNCQFTNCIYAGIWVDQFSPVIKENCFESILGVSGSLRFGVFTSAGLSGTVDATNNYWGSPNGPYNVSGNPTGDQNMQYSDNVNVFPFNEVCGSSIEVDMSVNQLLSPSSACVLTDQEYLTVQVVNSGLSTQSNFVLGYVLDGNDPVTETVNTSLSSSGVLEFTFAMPLDLSDKTTYSIEVFVNAVGDQISSNNQVTYPIIHYPEFDAETTGDLAVCEETFTAITSSGGVGYFWNTGSLSNTIFLVPTQDTSYQVTVTNATGCVDVDTVNITVLAKPEIPIIEVSSNYICPGGTVELSTTANNIIWSPNNEVTNSISVSQGGVYTVTTAADNGCFASAPLVSIVQGITPTIFAASNGVICEGSSEILFVNTSSSFSSFLWSTGETTQSITVAPTETEVYTVAVSTLGCDAELEYTVTVEPDLPVGAVGNLFPANGATGVGLPVNLSWSPAENAAVYDLLFGVQGSALTNIGTFTEINLNYSNLNYGTTYCWQVIPQSCSGTPGTASPVQCFTLEALPDLVVESISIPTTTAFAGNEIEVSWQVRNNSNETISASNRRDVAYLSTDQVLDANDQWVGTVTSNEVLSGNGVAEQDLTISLPDCEIGTYYLIVFTDRWNDVEEALENNNTGVSMNAITIQESPTPDLKAVAIPILNLAGPAQVGTSYDFNFQVINQGDLAVTQDFQVFFFVDTLSFYNPNSAIFLQNELIAENLAPDASSTLSPLEITLPESLATGTYYLHAVIDFYDQIEECVGDGNNISTSDAFQVFGNPKPDFEPLGIALPEGPVSNKENVSFSYEVRNNEAPFLGSLQDRIYLSNTPNALLAFPSAFKSGSLPLANAETKTRQANFQVPNNHTGWLYIFVQTNHTNAIAETDLGNNLSVVDSIEVVSPNLTPTEITIPSTVVAGTSMSVSWKDQNIGAGDLLNAQLRDHIYLSVDPNFDPGLDLALGSVTGNTTILANEALARTKSVSIPAGTVPGDYYLIVQTNANLSVYENNLWSDNVGVAVNPITISEGSYPDLVVNSIAPNLMAATGGDTIILNYEIQNNGMSSAIGNWEDRLYICACNTFTAEADLIKVLAHSQAVAVGATYEKSVEIKLPYNIPDGEYYFYVITDAENALYETSELNIRRSMNPVTITSYDFENVDLALQNVEPPCKVLPGVSATVYFETENEGSAATVAGNWYDGIVLSSNNVWEPEIDTLIIAQWPHFNDLVSNQSYANLKTFTLPENVNGSYYVLLVTDLFTVVNETDISNNAIILPPESCNGGPIDNPVTFPPKPDLSIEITNASNTGIAGQSMLVKYKVTNLSTIATVLTNWKEKAFLTNSTTALNGIALGDTNAMLDSLPAGESYEGELTADFPITAVGNYFLVLQTDAGNAVLEANENNNRASKAIFLTQPEPSDLIVENIIAAAVDTIATEMTVNWKLKNIGINPAEGVLSQSVYLSKDQVYDVNDVLLGTEEYLIELFPSQEGSFSLTGRLADLVRGDYFVLVRTDVENNILESEETNNDGVSLTTTFIEIPEVVIDDPAITAVAPLALSTFYRIEVSAAQAGSSIRISLDSDDPMAFNELYVAYEYMPTRTTYDIGYEQVFSPNQALVIPEVAAGTYYVMAYAVEGSATQTISLKAETIPFDLLAIQTNEGGNTGLVTSKITGGKFVEGMEVWLVADNGATITANTVALINSTMAYVTFDLTDVAIGVYDVRCRRTNPILEEAILEDGFTVVTGTIGNQLLPQGECTLAVGGGEYVVLNVSEDLSILDFEKLHPPSVRPGQTVQITLRYTNNSNVDVPIPQRLLASENEYPIALELTNFEEEMESVNLNFPFDAGSQSFPFIPPGGTVTRKFYAKALGGNEDFIKIRIFKL